ncbi:MAG: iron ABC transporter permease [Anaerolinea sp.]|nr:iron ABC transporter permease [Anaerolinea sp.]
MLLALPLAFLGAFLLYPLQGIIRESLLGETASLDDLRPLWEDSYYLERLWFTTWQAALSTLLTVGLALPCAWVLAHHEFPGKALVLAVVTIPFVLPTVVVAVAFSALVGPRGLANAVLMELPGVDEPPIRLFNTIWIILLAHVFYNLALAARIIAAAWANLDPRLGEVAAVLGYGRLERFARVTAPLLKAPILAAGSLVFLFSFTSFGVILILGGPRYATIETEIYREMVFIFRPSLAAALALIQMGVTFAFLAFYARLSKGRGVAAGVAASPARPGRAGRLVAASIVVALVLFTVAPLLALVERSLHGAAGYTLEFYRSLGENTRNQALFVTPFQAARNSVMFAASATALAVPLGMLTAYGIQRVKRGAALVEALLLMPLGVSAITLGLGFLVTLDEPPLELRASRWLIVIAHTLVAYPFVARAISGQLRAIDPRLREAARTMGESSVGVFFRVDLPLLWRAIVVGAVFAFAISMGEFGATLLIARPEWPTLPLAIFRYLGQPGALNYGQALAMSTILMSVTAAGFLVIDRMRIRGLGTF